MKKLLAPLFAAAVLTGAAIPAHAGPRALVINLESHHSHNYTVSVDQPIWIAAPADSDAAVSAVEVSVSSTKILAKGDEGDFSGPKGLKKDLATVSIPYHAIKRGHADIVVSITRPTLGGIRSHTTQRFHITVK